MYGFSLFLSQNYLQMCCSNISRFLVISMVLFCGTNILSAQTSLKLKYKHSTVYAGIEVGSKGVKMSLIEMAKKNRDNNEYNILKDTSVNTDFISFSPATFEATLQGFCGLFNTAISGYNIPPDKIFTVVSSGVKVSAEKDHKTDWIKNLIDSFKLKIHDPARKVDIIDVAEEARLSHLGIIPESKRYTTFLIDIGSGNTKGGYFPNTNIKNIKLFELSWGTKSTANATDYRLEKDESIANYYRQLQRVLAGDANKEIIYAVNVSGAYNMSDNIAFSGGAAWAVATLLYPELLNNPVVPVTYEDVEKFNDQLYNNYSSVSEKSILETITNNTLDKKAISKSVQTVNKVFDQKAMLAGTGLLLKIMRQFEGISEKKQFYLVKNGQVGWISAYVNQSIAQ
jgi:hypothetical protein